LELLEHPPHRPDWDPSDIRLFGPLKTTLVANSMRKKKLKRKCGSG
jgi:hypothetical protein